MIPDKTKNEAKITKYWDPQTETKKNREYMN